MELPAQHHIAPIPEITKTTMWDVAFSDSLHGLAVGDYGVIQRTSDGGRSWVPRRSSDQFAFRHVHYFSPRRAIATGFWSSVYLSDDSGETWRKVETGTKEHLIGLSAVGSKIWLSGYGGLVLVSSDSGETWNIRRAGTNNVIDAISFSDSLHGWCSSIQGGVFRTTDGGASWNPINSPSSLPLTTLWASSPDECWAAGFNGLIARTINGGVSWRTYSVHETHFQRLFFDRFNRGWAVGRRGVIVRYEPKRDEWVLFDVAGAGELHSITDAGESVLVAVGKEGAIIRIGIPGEKKR
ncbi:MAG: YCF48-related protein [Bacteroidota bacterium]|nr:YCF48-related protein [Bacteroidota bacterium]